MPCSLALGKLLGVPVPRLPLYDGVELCCDRDGLLYGLALARRALAARLAMPRQPEPTLCFDRREPVLSPDQWPGSADFLLARVAVGGGLADLTMADIRFWMFWLGLDYVLHR